MAAAAMNMWQAVVLVGLGSYAFRLVPLLLGERIRLSKRSQTMLRDTGVGAMTALVVLGVKRVIPDTFSPGMLPVGIALAVSGALALRGRSMALVVLCGAATYGLALSALHMLTS